MTTIGSILSANNIARKTPTSPAIIRGSVDLSTYPGFTPGIVNTATRLANGTALQGALDWCATNKKYAELPPGRYEYSCSTVDNAKNVGLQAKVGVCGMIGAGYLTSLVQYASNHPVLTLGPMVGTYDAQNEYRGLSLRHGVSQIGNTSAHGLQIGNLCFCDFDRIVVGKWNVDPYFAGAINRPYMGIYIGGNQFFFSNKIGSISCDGAQQHLLRDDIGGTGNVWQNVYLGGGTFGSREALSGSAVWFNNYKGNAGRFDQLNIEWTSCAAGQPTLRSEGYSMSFGTLHLEGNQMNGSDPILAYMVDGLLVADNVEVVNPWIAAVNASGTPLLFSTYNQGRLDMHQLNCKWDGAGTHAEAVASMAFRLFNRNTGAGVNAMCRVGAGHFQGYTGSMTLDANIPGAAFGAAGAIGDLLGYEYNRSLSRTVGARITMLDADLTIYGRHQSSRVTLEAALTANRSLTLSDKLSASGAGSTSQRRAGDIVEVYRWQAGAFDLIVKDAAAATLFTFSGAGSANTSKTFEWTGSTWVAL